MNTKKNLTIVIVGEDNNSITAQVTKAFEKKSKVFGTEEYNIWRDFKADNISKSVIMTTKKIKRNTEKKTNKNLTYSNMLLFIEAQNKKELIAEFNQVKSLSKIQKSPYRYVLNWFEKTFEGYTEYPSFFENKSEEASTVN